MCRRVPKRGSIHDGDPSARVKCAHKLSSGEAGSRNVDQNEHPGLRLQATEQRYAAQASAESVLASAQKLRPRSSASAASASAVTAASWIKPGNPNSMHIARCSAWPTSASGPTSQPARQPVIACVFDRLPERHDTFRQARGKAWDAAPGCEPCVDFVADQPQVMALRELTDDLQFALVENHAARIVRCGPQDRPSSWCHLPR